MPSYARDIDIGKVTKTRLEILIETLTTTVGTVAKDATVDEALSELKAVRKANELILGQEVEESG